MTILNIQTKKQKEILDISNEINDNLSIENGVVHLFILHTTASITIAEPEPGIDRDFLDAIEAISPKLNYKHPHDPAHAPDHIMTSIIGNSLTIPVENGKLLLGTWQSVVLVELYGPKSRNIVLKQMEC